jgi:protein-tyrosine kinase
MKKSNLAFADFSKQGMQSRSRPIAEINLNAPSDLPIIDLIELYSGIESALPGEHGRVVQFVSATSGFGNEQIALEMAWAASRALGKRILLVNCAKFSCGTSTGRKADRSSEDTVVQLATMQKGLVKVSGQELYLADLRNGLVDGEILTSLDDIDEQFEKLRPFFDVIALLAPSADSDPLAMALAQHVDGSVLIIEAEETRRSAAIRLREILARSGHPIVGAVLNNRRTYIPHWLARFI